LQSTFGCPKTLRGSTATDPSKLGHFRLKSPPRLYPVFKVLKTAQVDGKFSTIQKKSKCLLQEPLFIRIKNGSRERWIFLRTGDDPCLERSLCLTQWTLTIPLQRFYPPKVRAEHRRFFVDVISASVTVTLPNFVDDPWPATQNPPFNRPI